MTDKRKRGKEDEQNEFLVKHAKQHRCHPRLQDFLCSIARYNPDPRPTWSKYMQCMRSNKGDEPTEPFYYLNLDQALNKGESCMDLKGQYKYYAANAKKLRPKVPRYPELK
ncbi:hypothetical protein AAMO2058_001500700 [Amorphochlora amoebiformis]|mmetsp:Transcript_9711/g.15355  ORF Transcript_9711/g.15355 Transcript_9711/m.15355 type:complete len:111 (-) Transcript_9711:210-542(-)